MSTTRGLTRSTARRLLPPEFGNHAIRNEFPRLQNVAAAVKRTAPEVFAIALPKPGVRRHVHEVALAGHRRAGNAECATVQGLNRNAHISFCCSGFAYRRRNSFTSSVAI